MAKEKLREKPWWSTPRPQVRVASLLAKPSVVLCKYIPSLCFLIERTVNSAGCHSVYWTAQLEDSTAKGASQEKYMLCPPHPWERTASVPAQVTFALSIKGGHGANTIILSGLLAINLPFVVCSFCPPSSQTPAEVARSLSSRWDASFQPLLSHTLWRCLSSVVSWGGCWGHLYWERAGAGALVGLVIVRTNVAGIEVPRHASPSGPPIFGLQDATLAWQESFWRHNYCSWLPLLGIRRND